jgi:hypothetical protein
MGKPKKSDFLKSAQKGEFNNQPGNKGGQVSSKANFVTKSNPARKKG